MPRIRKKTSNRGSTNERKKILHKVRESRKKTAKAAKKNPQWKSNQKKDPGIPSNYPYKDQLLAEVAEQRRQVAEEKQRRQDSKNTPKPKKKSKTDDDDESSEDEASEEQEESAQNTFDSIASLSAKRLIHATAKGKPAPVVEEVAGEDEEEVPFLINHDLPTLQSVMDQADVVVHVLDARDPNSFRSSYLETLTAEKPGQKILFILTKIDTCPRESVTAWATHLRSIHPTFLFRAASSFLPAGPELVAPPVKAKGKGKAKERTDDAWGLDSVVSCLEQQASEKNGDEPLAVAVVGVTNSGKTSFINSLVRKAVFPVYTLASSIRGPTTTALPQEVSLPVTSSTTKSIRLIDTPGLSWALAEETPADIERVRARDILLRNKGRIDRLKDPAFAVAPIVTRGNTEDLMLLYNLPAFSKNDPESFLNGVARANQLIKKKGALDLTGAARVVLRDWSIGKLPWFTMPPSAPSSSLKGSETALYSNNETILGHLSSRKDMRKSGGGLVKFSTGSVETRKPTMEASWAGLKSEGNDDSDEEEQDEELRDVDGDDDDADEDDIDVDELANDLDEDDDEEEEEVPAPIIASKQQKRKAAAALAATRPVKKVAFGADPKESKQARRTAGSQLKSVIKTQVKTTISVQETKTTVAVQKTTKAANAGGKGSKSTQAAMGSNGEAYDFGKFF